MGNMGSTWHYDWMLHDAPPGTGATHSVMPKGPEKKGPLCGTRSTRRILDQYIQYPLDDLGFGFELSKEV